MPLSSFSGDASRQDGKQRMCRACCSERQRARRRKYGKSALNRADKYGLRVHEVLLLMSVPVCQACGRDLPDSRSMKFDHCHSGDYFRGILCHHCNLACAGTSDEVVARLSKCIDYCQRDMERNEQV